jgi:hypothetical protein
MKCEEVIELMHRELDGDLIAQEQQGLLQHLASCHDCHTLFEQLKTLSFRLESLPKVTPAYSIVDQVLPILDQVDQTNQARGLSVVKSTERSKSTIIKRSRKLWIPGLALTASFFIGILLLNSTSSDINQMSQDSNYNQPAESIGIASIESPESDTNMRAETTSGHDGGGEEVAKSGTVSGTEESGSTHSVTSENVVRENELGEKEKTEEETQLSDLESGYFDEDPIEYPSPDGVYSAYEGYGDEDIRVKKEDRPYYMTKAQNQWEKPWEVISMEWISNSELYYILYHPEEDEEQYWMLYADERTEEQLEGPYVTEAE